MGSIFSLYLALIPLSVYSMLIGLVNMSRRPFVVSGTRDLAVVLMAISGWILVGPVELFFPTQASWRMGGGIWFYLLLLYGLLVFLVLLAQRSRLVIYGISLLDLRPILSELALELDGTSRWAGDALSIPRLGVLLYLEENASLKNVSLIACGRKQNIEGWRKLQSALTRTLQSSTRNGNRRAGLIFFLVGLIFFLALHGMIWMYSAEFLRSIPDFLRL